MTAALSQDQAEDLAAIGGGGPGPSSSGPGASAPCSTQRARGGAPGPRGLGRRRRRRLAGGRRARLASEVAEADDEVASAGARARRSSARPRPRWREPRPSTTRPGAAATTTMPRRPCRGPASAPSCWSAPSRSVRQAVDEIAERAEPERRGRQGSLGAEQEARHWQRSPRPAQRAEELAAAADARRAGASSGPR